MMEKHKTVISDENSRLAIQLKDFGINDKEKNELSEYALNEF